MAVFATGQAATQFELMQQVTQRNALMMTMLSAYWPLLKISNGENSNLSDGVEAARTITEATDKIVALFPGGTAKGQVPGTRARPEIWSKPEEFQAAVDILKAAATSLQAAAEAGDLAAFETHASRLSRLHARVATASDRRATASSALRNRRKAAQVAFAARGCPIFKTRCPCGASGCAGDAGANAVRRPRCGCPPAPPAVRPCAG